MPFSFLQILAFFLWALLSAALEVHIEGPHGWARSLPTWRRTHGGRLFRFVQAAFFGGRPVTGYHCCMFALQLAAFHLCYFQGTPLTWSNECMTLALFFLVCPTWDFLWFVLNPAYGLKRFKKEEIEWHAGRWWVFGLFPVDYAVGALISLTFMVGAFRPYEDILNGINMVASCFLWAVLLLIATDVLGPWYRARRVQMLARNDSPIVESNVDDLGSP